MADISIIVGSMLGNAEYVAEACEQTLVELGHQVELHFSPNLTDIEQKNRTWLICTSTHGAGDYPDNIQPFVDQLTASPLNFDHNQFFVIGLGDSNYDTFCYAAKNIKKLMISKGSKELIELLTLDISCDIDPEQASQDWIIKNQDQLS